LFVKKLYETTLSPVILPIEHLNADGNGIHSGVTDGSADRNRVRGLE
jgi:hypothetical protein